MGNYKKAAISATILLGSHQYCTWMLRVRRKRLIGCLHLSIYIDVDPRPRTRFCPRVMAVSAGGVGEGERGEVEGLLRV